ncbi:MAG: PaaI family thioesterase [Candidatus Bipolaricaulia bacterium]
MAEKSLQEQYAPHNTCFGCGSANPKGLRIRSFAQGDKVVAEWAPDPRHEAFPGVLNGGIIGTLLDCHSNWTVAWYLTQRSGAEHPPVTVTADYAIELIANGQVCATCRGTFVAVKPGHPAYHRW